MTMYCRECDIYYDANLGAHICSNTMYESQSFTAECKKCEMLEKQIQRLDKMLDYFMSKQNGV